MANRYPPFLALTQLGIYQLPDTLAGEGDVVGPTSATDGHVTAFDGVTGKLVKDSGIPVAGLVTGPASAVGDNFSAFNATTGKLIKDSGKNAGSFTAAPVAVPAGATAAGTPGTWAYDSGFIYVCVGATTWLRFVPDPTFV